jgi:large subunit ribosomal protein L24
MKIKLKTHVKVGDRIKIIAGDQKGLIGNILSLNKKKAVAIIDSVSSFTKLVKQKDTQTSIEIQPTIHISNLMLWDNIGNIASRVGSKIINNEKKRYFKKSGNVI